MANRKGTSTLEVIAALVIFSVAAAGLAVVIPMAYTRLEDWRGRINLSRYLEKHLEDVRSIKYRDLTVGDTGVVTDGSFTYRRVTAYVQEGTDGSGNPAWVPQTGGLSAVYYDNINFTGATVERVDAQINFNWANGSPAPGIAADTFSVRWTGFVEPQYSQTYTFYARTDDGVRVWVNNVLIIDNWTDQSATEVSGTIALTAGVRYPIRMEYYENGGEAVAELRWSSPSTPKNFIPQNRLFSSLTKMTTVTVTDAAGVRSAQGIVMSFNIPAHTIMVYDDFESGGWAGGAGWNGPWTPTGTGAVVTAGTPYQGMYHLRLLGHNQNPGAVNRAANLTGLSGARLQFWWKATGFEGRDRVTVTVNDGANHTVLTIDRNMADNIYHFEDIDLSAYAMTANFRITITSGMNQNNDTFYLDDLKIVGEM